MGSPTFHVGILGLGCVGLPLALTFIERTSYLVTGYDVDVRRVASLMRGESYLQQLDSVRVERALETGRFHASHDFSDLDRPDALLIAVPTPLSSNREPDLSCIVAASEAIAARLRPGQLVVLESTTFPGTTDDVVKPILERSGLACGTDFFLAFSPEREDPGNASFTTAAIPKLVAGTNPTSTRVAAALYRSAFEQVVPVASPKVAEASKLTENVFRAVNIALVNELKMVFEAMDIDIWEVLDAAATKPFGYMRFTPGPGLGGHCIALDPYYLSWKARAFGVEPRLVELAGQINGAMPEYVLGRLDSALTSRGKSLACSQILILGLAYKPNVNDVRESPALEIVSRLLDANSTVHYHDPHVPEASSLREWPSLPRLRSQPLTAALLAGCDAVVIVTDHAAVDYDLVLEHAQLIVDPRGVYRGTHPKVIHA